MDKQQINMADDNHNLKKYQPADKSRGRYWTYIFLFALLLFFCTFGVTYSFYKGGEDDPNHGIETGNILFTYSDVNQVGNGIHIRNAVAIPDSQGKLTMGTNQYFDFNITTTTKSSNLHYEVLIYKDQVATLGDHNVKVYLSQKMGGYENELVLKKVSELPRKTYNGKEYYVLYGKTLKENLENYSDFFRLRMWVDEKAEDYDNQTYSIKVDVYAYQVEEE